MTPCLGHLFSSNRGKWHAFIWIVTFSASRPSLCVRQFRAISEVRSLFEIGATATRSIACKLHNAHVRLHAKLDTFNSFPILKSDINMHDLTKRLPPGHPKCLIMAHNAMQGHVTASRGNLLPGKINTSFRGLAIMGDPRCQTVRPLASYTTNYEAPPSPRQRKTLPTVKRGRMSF